MDNRQDHYGYLNVVYMKRKIGKQLYNPLWWMLMIVGCALMEVI